MAKKGKKVPVKVGETLPTIPYRDWFHRMDENIEALQRWMDEELWGPRPWRRRGLLGWREPSSVDIKHPLMDIRDTGKAIVVEVEMAGIPKEKIAINVTENSIEIRGEVEEKEEEGYYRRERRYSTSFRQMPLPEAVIPEKTTAKLEDGVLHIDLPKKEPTMTVKPHKVEIK